MKRELLLAGLAGIALIAALAWRGGGLAEPGPKQKGISYAGYVSGQYAQPYADLSLGQLRATGANWVSVIVTGYQSTITSTTIMTATATPSDTELSHAIAWAHRLGLKVMLKPHVDLSDDPGHWRGEIGRGFGSESEWAAWFASYRQFIERYAGIAQAHNVEQFAVGTELLGTTPRTAAWREVVAGIRARFSGTLVYAADWAGEADRIDWWDALDYIGVDAYYPLTDKNGPAVAELKVAWEARTAGLSALASRWGKSIIITEIGYKSRTGAARNPSGGPGSLDLQEQAKAYQAAFEALYGEPWLAGLYWWFWGTDTFEGGLCDDNFTPHDKPAEDLLRAWYGGSPRTSSAALPPPDYSVTQTVYADSFGPGWEDWSWNATRNAAATGAVYSGTHAISVTLGAYGGLSLWRRPFESGYYWLELYVRGVSSAGPGLWVFFNADDGAELRKRPVDDCRYTATAAIEPDTWNWVLIPLSQSSPAILRLISFGKSA